MLRPKVARPALEHDVALGAETRGAEAASHVVVAVDADVEAAALRAPNHAEVVVRGVRVEHLVLPSRMPGERGFGTKESDPRGNNKRYGVDMTPLTCSVPD